MKIKPMRYRIISTPSVFIQGNFWYQAQFKFFNLFWLNCGFDPDRPGSSRSQNIEDVEKFIDAKINGVYVDRSSKVVKVYE